MTASAPRKNAEERDEKRSCPAVSYGRVSDGRKESRRSGSDGDGPRFVESRIHLALSGAGVSW
jgi:hypothetical protein